MSWWANDQSRGTCQGWNLVCFISTQHPFLLALRFPSHTGLCQQQPLQHHANTDDQTIVAQYSPLFCYHFFVDQKQCKKQDQKQTIKRKHDFNCILANVYLAFTQALITAVVAPFASVERHDPGQGQYCFPFLFIFSSDSTTMEQTCVLSLSITVSNRLQAFLAKIRKRSSQDHLKGVINKSGCVPTRWLFIYHSAMTIGGISEYQYLDD